MDRPLGDNTRKPRRRARGRPASDNDDTPALRRTRNPLATQAEIANEPEPFPSTSDTMPFETAYDDWRDRVTRNLARRSDGRWEPLTRLHATDV